MPLAIPTWNQDRGPRKFDTVTGSSESLPANYCETTCFDNGTGCDEVDYVVRQFDITINDNVNCVAQNIAVASIKVRMLKANAVTADYTTLIDYIRDQIKSLPDPCV